RAATPARRTTAAKPRAATPVRRRKRVVKKKSALADMFTPQTAESGFKQLIGVGAGYIASEKGGTWLNPDGSKNQLEIIAKIGLGFVLATAGKMPSVGAGVMASGIKKVIEVNGGMGLSDGRTNYLQDRPIIVDSGMSINDNGYLQDNYLQD